MSIKVRLDKLENMAKIKTTKIYVLEEVNEDLYISRDKQVNYTRAEVQALEEADNLVLIIVWGKPKNNEAVQGR
jgi:hypothetical protein